jgi:hypothetical protein
MYRERPRAFSDDCFADCNDNRDYYDCDNYNYHDYNNNHDYYDCHDYWGTNWHHDLLG